MTVANMTDEICFGSDADPKGCFQQVPFKLLFHDFKQKSLIAWDALVGISPKAYDSEDFALRRLIKSHGVKHAVVALDYEYYDMFSVVPGPK